MKIFIAIIAGSCLGLVVFNGAPLVARWLHSYYQRLTFDCGRILSEAHVDLARWQRVIFYPIGPIASIALALIFVRPLWVAVMVAAVFSFLTRNLSVRIARTIKRRRIAKIKTQLADALGLVSNALRSGLSLPQGFQMVAEEMPAPISQEFRIVVSSQQLGKTFDAALLELKERIPLEEIDLLVSSLTVLRETGGNIIETLEVITHTIREEQRVKSKIKTVTTQGVAQAVVITLLPFFLAAALYVISPQYIKPLFTHPLGWGLIAFMVLLQGVGAWMMKRIVTVKV